MASTADFKNGLVLVIDGQLWQINEFQHVKPGKGPAFVRTKLKNVLSGKVVDKVKAVVLWHVHAFNFLQFKRLGLI